MLIAAYCHINKVNTQIRIHTFGDLVHWHSHMHAVVCEGVFTESGHFVHIPETWKHSAVEIWQDKIFELLLNEKKIDQETVAGMRTWRHSTNS